MRAQDLERVMLQFAVHFLHVRSFLRSQMRRFWDKRPGMTSFAQRRAQRQTTSQMQQRLLRLSVVSPESRTESLSRRLAGSHVPTGRRAIFYAVVMPDVSTGHLRGQMSALRG